MRARRYRMLTPASLADLPERCRDCPIATAPTPETTWVRGAMTRWGFVGVGAYHDDALVGYVLACPALHLPRSHPLLGLVQPRDAVLLRAHVEEGCERAGYGRGLVAALAGGLCRRPGTSGIVALGAGSVADCTQPPVPWLERAGFTAVAVAGGRSILRLDLGSTLRWRVSGVGRRLADLVPRPLAPPEPTARCVGR